MLQSCVHSWYYSIHFFHINSDSFNFVLLSLSMINKKILPYFLRMTFSLHVKSFEVFENCTLKIQENYCYLF